MPAKKKGQMLRRPSPPDQGEEEGGKRVMMVATSYRPSAGPFRPKAVDDHYNTPPEGWALLLRRLKRGLRIWDPFFSDGEAAQHITEQGFKVIHGERDFWTWSPPIQTYDLICTNPPYSCKKRVLERLLELNKPFAVLLPLTTICALFFQKLLGQDPGAFQLIIPKRRLGFSRPMVLEEDSRLPFDTKKPTGAQTCPFDTVWITHRLEPWLGRGRQIFYEDQE